MDTDADHNLHGHTYCDADAYCYLYRHADPYGHAYRDGDAYHYLYRYASADSDACPAYGHPDAGVSVLA